MSSTPQSIRTQLKRTWPVFFARHGNLTAVQIAAIPPILAGDNTLVVAATASGKTEAALAPLIERHLRDRAAPQSHLAILYICPTRALTADLHTRLSLPLEMLGVSLDIKTSDAPYISFNSPPTLLITTPESTDSLLTRAPRLFTDLAAIVLDEVHLFDNTSRGDHLRCLLRRIEQIRAYHQQRSATSDGRPLQRIALSATVADPAGIAQRYLTGVADDHPQPAKIVAVAGGRQIDATRAALDNLPHLARLLTARATSDPTIRKTLLFCNTRNEVEQTAAFLRQQLGYAAAVLVHYSNLDPLLRREVEAQFAAASVAICVCTSTLELGIDIGSIDDVVLVGPPPSLASFLQRIGRGGRRGDTTRVFCLFRSSLEALRFEALLALAVEETPSPWSGGYHFRPSVLVQQIFSRLKQSPTGAIRLADVAALTPAPLGQETLRAICANLAAEGYLRTGRPGEWRPGPALDELLDAHEIYSNIGADALAVTVVDAFSGRVLARIDRVRMEGDRLLLGGRAMEVVWREWRRIGVRTSGAADEPEDARFATAPFALPLDVSQGMAAVLGFAAGDLPIVADEAGAWLFHFWGEIYGQLLANLLQETLYPGMGVVARESLDQDDEERMPVRVHNAVCLRLPEPILSLPAWHSPSARRELQRLLPRLQPFLDLGRFHALLPQKLAHATAVSLCDLPTFEGLYHQARLVAPDRAQQRRLLQEALG